MTPDATERHLAEVCRLWVELRRFPARARKSAAYLACQAAIRVESDALNAALNVNEPSQPMFSRGVGRKKGAR
jgi:hypothetical protein